jgi:hypothetical protein
MLSPLTNEVVELAQMKIYIPKSKNRYGNIRHQNPHKDEIADAGKQRINTSH